MARKKKGQSKGKDAQPVKGVDYEVFGEDEYQVTKDRLISLAEAINENLDLDADDAIDLEAGIKEIGASITELFDEIFTSDSFEDEQWAVLYKMGCMPVEPSDDEEEEEPVEEWPDELMERISPFLPDSEGEEDEEEPEEEEEEEEPEPEPEPKKKSKGKGKGKKKEPEEEEEEPEEEEEEEEEKEEPEEEKDINPEDLLAELKKLKTKKEMDQFVENNDIDVDTSERNPIKFKKQIGDVIKGKPEPEQPKKSSKKEKAAPKKEKAPGKKSSAKKEKAAPKKEKAPGKKSHEEAFMDALDKMGIKKKGASLGEIAEKGCEIYYKANGSEGSLAMQEKQGLTLMKALERYGVVEKVGNNFFLLEEE